MYEDEWLESAYEDLSYVVDEDDYPYDNFDEEFDPEDY